MALYQHGLHNEASARTMRIFPVYTITSNCYARSVRWFHRVTRSRVSFRHVDQNVYLFQIRPPSRASNFRAQRRMCNLAVKRARLLFSFKMAAALMGSRGVQLHLLGHPRVFYLLAVLVNSTSTTYRCHSTRNKLHTLAFPASTNCQILLSFLHYT